MPDPTLRAKITADASGLVKETKRARDALGRYTKDSRNAARETGAFGRISAGVSGGLAKLRLGVKTAGTELRSAAKSATAVTSTLASLGAQVGLAVVALAALGTAAVNSFAQYEQSFAQVRTLIDESLVDTRDLSDSLRDLSVRFGVDLKEATEAAYQAISAGQEPASVVQFLEEAFKGAAAGAATTKEAVDLFTTTLNAFGSSAGSVTDVADVLFATIRAGKTTAAELAASLGQVAPVAATAGVSLAETGGALAALTASGLSTAEAATAIKATLVGILKPSNDAGVALGKLGINAKSLEESGFLATVSKVRDAVNSGNVAVTDLFPNVRALVGVATLAGEGFDKFTASVAQTEGAAGAASLAFQKTADTIAFRFNVLRQSVTDSFRGIGETIAPVARGIVDAFTGVSEDTRFEIQALQDVVENSATEMGRSISNFANDFRDSGGLVTQGARAASTAFRSLATAVDAISEPVSGVIAGFDLIARVARTGLTIALVNALTPLQALINLFTIVPRVVLEAARIVAEGLGLDQLERKIRGAQSGLVGFVDQVNAFQSSLRESARESADEISGFADTFDASMAKARDASGALRDIAEDADEFGEEIRDQAGTIKDLRVELERITPQLSEFGVSSRETGQALRVLSSNGQTASDAANGLRSAITALNRPTDQAREALASFGVTAQTIRSENLAQTFARIRTAVDSGRVSIEQIFPTLEAANAATILAGRGFNSLASRIGEVKRPADQAAASLRGAGVAAGAADTAFRSGSTSANVLTSALASISSGAAGAVAGLSKLPSTIRSIVAGIQAIGNARTPAQALQDQQAQVSSLLAAAEAELNSAVARADRTRATQVSAAAASRDAALAANEELRTQNAISEEEFVQRVEAVNARYEESVKKVNDAIREQAGVARVAYDQVIDQVGQLAGGLEQIRDQSISRASQAADAEIADLKRRAEEARDTIDDLFLKGEISQTDRIERLAALEKQLFEQIDRSDKKFDRLRQSAEDAFQTAGAAAAAATEQLESFDASTKALNEGFFDLSETIDSLSSGLSGDNLNAAKIYFELFEQDIISAEELTLALKGLQEQFAANAAATDAAAAASEKRAAAIGREAAAVRDAAAADQERSRALTSQERIQREIDQRRNSGSRTDRLAGFGFGIQSSPRAAPGQRRTITGRPINDSGQVVPRGILSFDKGGPVLKDQIAKVHAGEFVLNPGGLAELGKLLGTFLNNNQATKQFNVTTNVDVQGSSRDEDQRSAARAMLPEIQRAVNKGISGKSVL